MPVFRSYERTGRPFCTALCRRSKHVPCLSTLRGGTQILIVLSPAENNTQHPYSDTVHTVPRTVQRQLLGSGLVPVGRR